MLLFAGAFLICQFVLMMQFLWRYVDELIGKGLSMKVLAEFFWYMALMLVPQALPLAILLAALITFGNLGESSELTAIKASGVSLMQVFRSVITICVVVSLCSFVFQNYVGPDANLRLRQLLISMKQKSPELEIPEGIFYDGIPRSNIFVQKKDMNTGMLYGLTIYRMTGSYEDQAIILADSGLLQTTAERKHLLMTLWNGEWFENMQAQEMGNKASVPYRRETFYHKQMLLDFNADFSLTDEALLSNDARGKGLSQLIHDVDSLENMQDSIGRELAASIKAQGYHPPIVSATTRTNKAARQRAARARRDTTTLPFDSLFAALPQREKSAAITASLSVVNRSAADLSFRAMIAKDYAQLIRTHRLQEISKFTIALQCLLFLFIGAPLGAIIRKGGLGLPVIISVAVFIVYYILDNSSTRMAKIGEWNIWIGGLLATMVLTPFAVFCTVQANRDSAVLNVDTWRNAICRLLFIRSKRHYTLKEVIINDPSYLADRDTLRAVNTHLVAYDERLNLGRLPNPLSLFASAAQEDDIEVIIATLETILADLANTTDKYILAALDHYPVVSTQGHRQPFREKWMNIATAVLVPVGVVFYCRIAIYRMRLHRDIYTIKNTNDYLLRRIDEMNT